jgi:DNA-binding beta-propeller fold protein YncE
VSRPERVVVLTIRAVRRSAVIAMALVGAAQGVAAQGAGGTFYMGTYTDKILVIDEATLAVRDSIKVSIGIPSSMLLSANRAHGYVRNPRSDKVEIVDLAARKSLGNFSLNSGSTIVQIWGMNVDPKERFAILLVKAYTKKVDRYEISRPTLLRYDLAKKAVTDTIPWPKGEERENAQIIFSPAGDLMYFFTSDDVLVYDAVTLKQVERWDLAQSFYEEGMGRINAGFGADIYEEPGFYTNLFRVSDPVNHRLLMGVARVDLANRSVESYTLGPNQPVSFRLAPGKKRAYGVFSEVGTSQFWTFDLETHRVVGKTEFAGRSRMGLTVGTSGNQLYIHTAGNTIDVYDTASFRKLRTVEYDADMTFITLIPARPAGPGN